MQAPQFEARRAAWDALWRWLLSPDGDECVNEVAAPGAATPEAAVAAKRALGEPNNAPVGNDSPSAVRCAT